MPGRALLLVGFLVIVLDLRVDGFDVISDPVGWMLVLVALLGLTRLHGGFVLAAVAASLGMLVGVGTLLDEPAPVLGLLEGLVMTGVVFGVCTGLVALAASARDRRAANVIRWLDLALTVLAVVPVIITGGERVHLTASAGMLLVPLLVVVIVLAVLIWFLVLVCRVDLLLEPSEPADQPAA